MKKRLLKIFIILLIAFILILIYSYFFGTNGLKVKEYKIINKKITNEFYGLKIVHISDIHYGKHFNEKDLKKVVEKTNEINPDIVVLTGDLYEEKLSNEQIDDLTNLLSDINANIKKYAITGNHDYGNDNWKTIIEKANFINLDDTYDVIYYKNSNIFISGVSTNIYGEKKVKDKLDSSYKYLESNKTNYNILLIHEPDYISEIDINKYDLILSGHSHNGQVRLPLIGAIYKPKGAKKYYKNYYKINNSDLFISSGLGTSMLNLRLFNKPSINFYRLTNK